MSYTISLQVHPTLAEGDPLATERIEEAARQVLRRCQAAEDAALSIVLATDEHIQQLNKQFRQIDAPTDILTFPFEPLPEAIEEDKSYLGDIVIGLPYAARRAQQGGHPLHDEILLLTVHGTLHLLGYDHDTPEKQAAMWKVQAEALQALNVTLEVPDYIHE